MWPLYLLQAVRDHNFHNNFIAQVRSRKIYYIIVRKSTHASVGTFLGMWIPAHLRMCPRFHYCCTISCYMYSQVSDILLHVLFSVRTAVRAILPPSNGVGTTAYVALLVCRCHKTRRINVVFRVQTAIFLVRITGHEAAFEHLWRLLGYIVACC